MGLFSKKDDSAKKGTAAAAPVVPAAPAAHRKKEGPTPTRKEAEAARRARVNPTLTKKERRERDSEAERRGRQEEIRKRDSDPGRTLMRDVVDSRFRLGEVVMPLLLVTLATSLIVGKNPQLANYVMIAFYVIVLAVLIDIWFMWRRFTKLLEERHPGYPKRGLFMYGMNRSLQIRRWRIPARGSTAATRSEATMAFSWTTDPALDPATATSLGVSTTFGTQAEAEAWFAEHWTDLDEAGVIAVSLLDGQAVVYGPMPLSA
ncbi:DUF3043 domain-containing protein [Raineyella fluvialis]|uniref:DUF3043 domain-containing protein n=1 Tax=Raineyella fluvialis TaxID=2662261 RepID=UPI00188FB760|nr:DUF3043 domain-containing protein [Raineyella fluvialis]